CSLRHDDAVCPCPCMSDPDLRNGPASPIHVVTERRQPCGRHVRVRVGAVIVRAVSVSNSYSEAMEEEWDYGPDAARARADFASESVFAANAQMEDDRAADA